VPQGGEAGEALSPTQPFPIAPLPLAPNRIQADDAFGLTPLARDACPQPIARPPQRAWARHWGMIFARSTCRTT